MSFRQALANASDLAKEYGCPSPIIRSDLVTLAELAMALVREIPMCSVGELRAASPREPDLFFMYDGIRFEIERRTAYTDRRAWREHFGILTELIE